MEKSSFKFIFLALMPISLFAQSATWKATSSNDLELNTNWNPASVPTAVATFDSTISGVNLAPQVVGPNPFALSNFAFPNSASAFNFTINGPYALNFSGPSNGITGTNTNTTISAVNTVVGMTNPQVSFSGTTSSIGDAQIIATNNAFSAIVDAPTTTDLAQILFDGSGDSPSHSSSITINSTSAALTAVNYNIIESSNLNPINDVGQVIFDGSGGKSGSHGSSNVVIEGGAVVTANLENRGFLINAFQGNNTGQILFDGSGGFSSSAGGVGQSVVTIGGEAQVLAIDNNSFIYSTGVGNNIAQISFDGSGGTSFGAGGQGSSTVVIKDSALVSATTPGYGYVGYDTTGSSNDTAQILFSGNGGLGYAASGKGSSNVTITDSAHLYASTVYYTGLLSFGNDLGQIVFDGSGGTGLAYGGSGSIDVTINGEANLNAIIELNDGYMYTQTAYANDLAQILFDGTPGLNYAGGGNGSCSVTIGESAQLVTTNNLFVGNSSYTNDVGQIVFDGSGGFGNALSTGNSVNAVIQDSAQLIANNIGTLNGGYGNDCAQILFDGSGGFQYDHAQKGLANVTLQGAAQLQASNFGEVISSGQIENNVAQILFDGSGGASTSGAGKGELILSIDDTVSLLATNSGDIGNSGSNFLINNIGQIVVDAGGGVNASHGGTGHLNALINTSTPITALNGLGGTISNKVGCQANKIGQIIFDGSHGNTSLNSGTGDLSVIFDSGASLVATNSGAISNPGTAQGVGQIIFDGTGGSSTIQLNGNTITAVNTVSGSVEGDQIAFYDTIVNGNGVASATRKGGTVNNGVAFYGPSTQAPDLQVQLTGTSLLADASLSPTFTMGPLFGDSGSTAVLNQVTTINTAKGVTGLFVGNISGSQGLKVIGSGKQILAGVNSYSGQTTVNSGNLTLYYSNIPGGLYVAPGATFSGVGTISGPATIAGTLRPGFSPGTMTFLNGLTLLKSATTVIEANASTASLLAVSGGNTTLAGTLHVVEDPGISLGKSYVIVTETGGDLLGTFQRITNTGNLIPVVEYTTDEVILFFQNTPATTAVLLNAPDRILRNIETLKHIDHRWEEVCGCCIQTPLSFYVEPTGSFGRVRNRENVSGHTFQTAGVRVGGDYFITSNMGWSFGFGAIAEYNHWWGRLYQHRGTYSSDGAYGSFYATATSQDAQGLSFNVIGGGGYNWYSFERYPTSTASIRGHGRPGGALADALIDMEYVWEICSYTITPIAALQYTYAEIEGYNERGAGIYNLRIDRQDHNALSLLLGGRFGSLVFDYGMVKIRPELSAYWDHQFLHPYVNSRVGALPTVGPSTSSVSIPGFGRDSLIVGGDVGFEFCNGMEINFNYDFWYNRDGLINFFLMEWKAGF